MAGVVVLAALAGVGCATTGVPSPAADPGSPTPGTVPDDLHRDVHPDVEVGARIDLDPRPTLGPAGVGGTSPGEAIRAEETLLAIALDMAERGEAEVEPPQSLGSAEGPQILMAAHRVATPHALAGRPLATADAFSLAGGGGFAAVGAVLDAAMRAGGVRDGSTTHVSDGTRVDRSIDAGDGGTGSIVIDADVDAAICPGVNGVAYGSLGFDARAEVTGAVDQIVAYRVEVSYTAQVDDAAFVATVDYEIETELSFRLSSDMDGAPAPFGNSVQLTIVGTGPYRVAGSAPASATATLDRASSGYSTDTFGEAAEAANTVGRMMLVDVLDRAEQHWRSGPCVEVAMVPSAGPLGLTSGQSVDVWIDPTARADDLPTGGVVSATLKDGSASVDPDGDELPAPASVTYVAGDSSGLVTAIATSNRGIGFGEVWFRVDTWKLDITRDGVTMRAVKCGGLAGEWRIQLEATFGAGTFTGELVAVVDPVTLRGPFTVTGVTVGGGVSVPQTGSGTLDVDTTGTPTLSLSDDTWSANGHSGPGPEMGEMGLLWSTSEGCPT